MSAAGITPPPTPDPKPAEALSPADAAKVARLRAAVEAAMDQKPQNFDINHELGLIEEKQWGRRGDYVIARQWAYHRALGHAGRELARMKTIHDKLVAMTVIEQRAWGEKNGDVAAMHAIADDNPRADEVFLSRLHYRKAEQDVTLYREALHGCQAELDDLRTQAADDRAASSFIARDQSRA